MIKEEVNVSKLYGLEATLPKEAFIKKYNVKEDGLSSAEADERLLNLGLNEIKQAKSKKWYHYLKESFFTPFNCILLRHCGYFDLYRYLFTTHAKLCQYYCNCYLSYSKYFIRLFRGIPFQ